MPYFKHQEIADTYHVSLKTIHNWISSAKLGKFDLELYEAGNRTYIVDSPNNVRIIAALADDGKKYRNALHAKVANPTKAFYNLYTPRQIHDIISNLQIHHEIPRQYNYMDGGALNWDRYCNTLEVEDTPNMLNSTIELLQENFDVIDRLSSDKKRVNVIDLGPGNAAPVRELLAHLAHRGVLHRYIAIDISQEMLRIAEGNIKRWFGDTVRFEGHVRDISFERFDDLLVEDMMDVDADETLNVALLLGGTPINFRSPYDVIKLISGSLGRDDLLLYSVKLDTEESRRYFNFNPAVGETTLSPNHSFIFNLLNIDESFYDVEMAFNEEKRVRYIQVRLKVALSVSFKFDNGNRSVNFDKGDTILLWRAWHQTSLETISNFEKSGFALLQSSLTKDRQFMLTISGLSPQIELES